MAVMQRVIKPKNKKIKRALEEREPKAIENTKKTIFARGVKCSEKLQRCLKDLNILKKPHTLVYNQKNEIRPFEDFTKIEIFCKKEDCSMFAFGTHNKKRPHNLILGRLYDYQLLDMIELGLEEYKSLSDFKNAKVTAEIKPCLLFSGSVFEEDDEMKRLKNLLIDFFRGPEVKNIRVAGLEHAIQFTATSDRKLLIRSYKIILKKSSNPKVPRVELEEIGPSMDFTVRRTHLASADLFKTACKQVKNVRKPKKIKNIEEDAFGSTLGKIHLPSQKMDSLQTRKMKGLKKAEKIREKKAKAEQAKKKAASKAS